jgi:putative transposase
MRQSWISREEALPVRRQCALVNVSRATHDAHQRPRPVDEQEVGMLRLIDEEYTRHPFFGSRRMVQVLRAHGWAVNRKRVQRLMQHLGLAGMMPGPHTSQPHPEHPVYPYLLRGMAIDRPNQAWSTDITYIRLAQGFGYLVAVMDGYSRKVLTWRLSNTLEGGFCVDSLQEAVRRFGVPEIFNTDQGAQFTSHAFIDALKAYSIQISMDGRGRAADNIFVERLWRTVKYEDIYIKDYQTLAQVHAGLKTYFTFYNGERRHQSLGYQTPNHVYTTGQGGGAKIVDKWSGLPEPVSTSPREDHTAHWGNTQQIFCCT